MAGHTRLARLWVSVALLLAGSCVQRAVCRVVEDGALGITRYDFRGVWGSTPGIVAVYLRPVCIGRTLFVRGVMGLVTVSLRADAGGRYTAPAALLDHKWSLQLVDRSTNSSVRVRVYKTLDRSEGTLSFSQLEAQLPVPGQLELLVEGSPWRHELYLPACALAASSPDHTLEQLPGSLLNDRHWAVVMLPRDLPAPPAQYAQLLMSHLEYHQRLGFAGTLLLCDLHQTHDLLAQPRVQQASDADSLLIWPWQHEQPSTRHALYWQVPRYQLVAVAGWGRATRLAFLDPDDFVVLPHAQDSSSSSGAAKVDAPDSCLARQYSQRELLEQLHWEANVQPSAATGSSQHTQEPEQDVKAALRLPRFDALLRPSDCSSDGVAARQPEAAACLERHARWHEQAGVQLRVSRCPVHEGGVRASRKPFISPHEVVAVRPYTATTRGGRLDGPTTPAACAFILHITNLLGSSQPWPAADAAYWQPGADAQPGRVAFDREAQLPARQSLQRCQQLQQPVQRRPPGSGAVEELDEPPPVEVALEQQAAANVVV